MNIKIKTIIFDFDGVLADSFEQLYALNKMAMAEVGLNLTKNQYRNFFMNNVHLGFREFIKDETVYEKFSEIRHRNFGKYYSAVKLFHDAAQFINKIKEKFILTIVSSGEKGWITKLLKNNDIQESFSYISASVEHSKEQKTNLILGQLAIRPQNAVMISDTFGDLAAAKKIGLQTVGVEWGFHSSKQLRLIKPSFVAKNWVELNSFLCT